MTSLDTLAALLDERPFTPPAQLPGGARVSAPTEGVVVIEPSEPIGELILSAGVHGNETAPMELLDALLEAMAAGALNPAVRLLVVFGNPQAIREDRRFIEHDMNRLFGADWDTAPNVLEARRAAALEALVDGFFSKSPRDDLPRWHLDLHTAIRDSHIERFGLHPNPADGVYAHEQIARLGALGVSTMLLQSEDSPTFSFWTRRYFDTAGFTLELGKALPFGRNNLARLADFADGLWQWIEGSLEAPDYRPEAFRLFKVARQVMKRSDDFRLHLDDKVANFTPLASGSVLAEDGDTRWLVDEDNARIIFPNPRVQSGQRAGLVIVPHRL